MCLAQVYGFVATSFLILTLVADFSAACSCGNQYHDELWKQSCVSDFVVQGRFVGAVIGEPVWNWVRYNFKTTEIFKKPENLVWTDSLYTQLAGSTCGYKHKDPFHNFEFVVTGYMAQDIPAISLCSFIKQRNQIHDNQIQNLKKKIAARCNRMPGFFDDLAHRASLDSPAWLADMRG